MDPVRLLQTLAGVGLSEEHIQVVSVFSELAFLPTSESVGFAVLQSLSCV